jgi:hypothetical protein
VNWHRRVWFENLDYHVACLSTKKASSFVFCKEEGNLF